jgi:urease accessory protein
MLLTSWVDATALTGNPRRCATLAVMLAAVPALVATQPQMSAGWEAQLTLRYARRERRTVLVERRHRGPLRVQKALYPEGEGVCQTLVVHPPGGIVGGDSLAIDLQGGASTHVQVTTPGAAKWYRTSGAVARATTAITAAQDCIVEWLPQEAILFDGARASMTTCVALARGAVFVGWDIVSLGRTAAGESFTSGRLHQSWELIREDRLVWCERAVLDGGSRALRSGAILGAAPVFGTMIIAGTAVSDELRAACREVAATEGQGAVTRMPEVCVARYCGVSPMAARTYFALLWRLLRPVLIGREFVPPRIWAT